MRAQLTDVKNDAMRLGDAPACRYLELVQRFKDLPFGTIVFKYQHDKKTFVRPIATPNGLSSNVLIGHRIDSSDRGVALGGTLCRVMKEDESFTVQITSVIVAEGER